MQPILKMKRISSLFENLNAYKLSREKLSMCSDVLLITDTNIDEIVKKYPLVVIDCWAEWCPPCKMLSPIIDELAKEMVGKIVFGKLNVDENPATPLRFNISAIPTLLIFKNGKYIDRITGALPKDALREKLKEYL